MAAASFEALWEGFCEIAGVPASTLVPDESGRLAFHVNLPGGTVNLVHCAAVSADRVFAIFDLGPVADPPGDGLRALLDANFVLQVDAPVFSRNPATGHASAIQVYSLFDATPAGLHQLVTAGTERAAQWREGLACGAKAAASSLAAPFTLLNLA